MGQPLDPEISPLISARCAGDITLRLVAQQQQSAATAPHEQILERVCAIDVAKASGMVCTRVPHPSRPGRRRTRVQEVDATTNSIIELGGQLAAEGIEKVTIESTSDYVRREGA